MITPARKALSRASNPLASTAKLAYREVISRSSSARRHLKEARLPKTSTTPATFQNFSNLHYSSNRIGCNIMTDRSARQASRLRKDRALLAATSDAPRAAARTDAWVGTMGGCTNQKVGAQGRRIREHKRRLCRVKQKSVREKQQQARPAPNGPCYVPPYSTHATESNFGPSTPSTTGGIRAVCCSCQLARARGGWRQTRAHSWRTKLKGVARRIASVYSNTTVILVVMVVMQYSGP